MFEIRSLDTNLILFKEELYFFLEGSDALNEVFLGVGADVEMFDFLCFLQAFDDLADDMKGIIQFATNGKYY